jgi:hypothetical protein
MGTGCTTAEDKSQLYLVTVITGSPAHWPDPKHVSAPDDTVAPRQLDGCDTAIGFVTGSWKFRDTGADLVGIPPDLHALCAPKLSSWGTRRCVRGRLFRSVLPQNLEESRY